MGLWASTVRLAIRVHEGPRASRAPRVLRDTRVMMGKRARRVVRGQLVNKAFQAPRALKDLTAGAAILVRPEQQADQDPPEALGPQANVEMQLPRMDLGVLLEKPVLRDPKAIRAAVGRGATRVSSEGMAPMAPTVHRVTWAAVVITVGDATVCEKPPASQRRSMPVECAEEMRANVPSTRTRGLPTQWETPTI